MIRNFGSYVRSRLGCTQQLLAVYLDVSTAQVALFETEKRKIPLKAKANYDALRKWIGDADLLPDTVEPTIETAKTNELNRLKWKFRLN